MRPTMAPQSGTRLIAHLSTFSTGAQQVLGHAATDPVFRNQLFRAPDQALSGFDLADFERQFLRVLDQRVFELQVESLKAGLVEVLSKIRIKERMVAEEAEAWEASLIEIFEADDDSPSSEGEGPQA